MDSTELIRIRQRSLLIADSHARTPRDVVSSLLALQAQDYPGALWAIGLRLAEATCGDVEAAIERREIVRTWPMRGTLHFVAAEDARWLTQLLAPRMLARAGTRERGLGLDDATFCRAREVFSAALEGGRRLSRPAAMEALEAVGISTDGQRGYHILWRLAQEGLLVLGPLEGKQQTFVLLDEWIPEERSTFAPDAAREEVLAVVAERYFRGHGPATLVDLARWAAITKRDAVAALAAVADRLHSADYDGERYWFDPGLADHRAPRETTAGPFVRLLPGFDEWLLGYTNHVAQLAEHHAVFRSRIASNGMISPTILLDGRIVGTWKRTFARDQVRFATAEFEPLSATARSAVVAQEQRYARFVGKELARDR